jgi:putative transposase
LALGVSLEICAAVYRKFCQKYQPKPKPEKRRRWGSKLLVKLKERSRRSKKASPGQKSFWEEWEIPAEDIRRVAEKFVLANCYDPKIACLKFEPL